MHTGPKKVKGLVTGTFRASTFSAKGRLRTKTQESSVLAASLMSKQKQMFEINFTDWWMSIV